MFLLAVAVFFPAVAYSQNPASGGCPRPIAGSEVIAPAEITSHNGVLQVALSLRSSLQPTGQLRYCYVDESGNQSPTLRVHPGDLLILKLKNELPNISISTLSPLQVRQNPCAKFNMPLQMQPSSTNLHFHGLMIPPTCHQDDVLNTLIQPQTASYDYRVRIPRSQPPGLYWYHPHPHGHSEEQVLGGASGALIVEGIERFDSQLAGLPERLLVIRDQARPSVQSEDDPKYGTGLKPPSKDLSVNFIPVPFPNYPPAIIKTKPSQRELWRVLNASADTFLDLHLLTNRKWTLLGLVALDGVPLNYEQTGSKTKNRSNRTDNIVQWVSDIPIPPGGRAEFLFDSPTEGGQAQLLTAGVDTVPSAGEDEDAFFAAPSAKPSTPDDDDYTPPRWLLRVVSALDAPGPVSRLPTAFSPAQKRPIPALGSVHPNRQRTLYFSEKVFDPKNPRVSTVFYLTEDGQQPSPFNPAAAPNITVRSGEVEDWVIENRSQEIHTFHIHQAHFLVLERDGEPVEENYLRDSVSLPYWDGVSPHYPSVKLRIDFRDPAIVGTFPYHCHILQHEDGGMMGTIQVLPRAARKTKLLDNLSGRTYQGEARIPGARLNSAPVEIARTCAKPSLLTVDGDGARLARSSSSFAPEVFAAAGRF
jgi:FtsP/CotA-like multicopper oxidase with cupredoxin domain